jgi:hypothetical protein
VVDQKSKPAVDDGPAEIGERTAELVDIYHLVFGDGLPVRRKVSRQQRPEDRSLALSALEGLSPSLATNYWDWLRVGMALHGVGDDGEMLAAWDRWSRLDAEKYEEGVCQRKWESFGKKGGLGLGSLIYWARQHGWELPRSGPKVEPSTPGDAAILERLDRVLAEGVESFFHDRELLEALARLAETDPPEFACVRAKLQKAGISLRSLDASISTFRQAVRAERPPIQSAGSYRIVGGRIVHSRMTKDGTVEIPLGNFTARITEVVTRDDGVEKSAVFAVEGELAHGQPLPRLQVPAAEFQRLEWVTTGWHGEAVLYAGSSIRDHMRCAIELLSCDRSRRLQYLHTGWREVGGRWIFLHAGGAIGQEGALACYEVELSGSLGCVHLPPPPMGVDLRTAVRASLGLLSLAPHRITVPVLAATYRAPLGDVDFSLHLAGPSGVFKSELTALLQSHYGAEFNARAIPGSWSSTENALEELAHAAKDILLTIDDFKPTGSSYDVQAYHRKADRLLRAVGNHSGRQRMNRDGKLRPERRPRGLVLSTGEEIPHGESLRARLLTVEIGYGDIDSDRLAIAQKVVGLDLAQPQESTALAVLARYVVSRETEYTVRHLRRWPPGTLYPHMAREVSALLGSRELCACRLVVDQTAVGRAVASLFRSAGAGSVLPVLISAGHAVTRGEDGCTHVPKKELVSAVQALLQTRRLKVAAGLPLAEALSCEMASFRAAVKLSGGEEDMSWREREIDPPGRALLLAPGPDDESPAGRVNRSAGTSPPG